MDEDDENQKVGGCGSLYTCRRSTQITAKISLGLEKISSKEKIQEGKEVGLEKIMEYSVRWELIPAEGHELIQQSLGN